VGCAVRSLRGKFAETQLLVATQVTGNIFQVKASQQHENNTFVEFDSKSLTSGKSILFSNFVSYKNQLRMIVAFFQINYFRGSRTFMAIKEPGHQDKL